MTKSSMNPSTQEYNEARLIVDSYEKAKGIIDSYEARKISGPVENSLNPANKQDLVELWTGKKIGDKFPCWFFYHKQYQNDFEGYVKNSGEITGINVGSEMVQVKFYEGHGLSRDCWMSSLYVNQTTTDYSNKFKQCIDKVYILDLIARQMFQHFISWYGPSFRPKGNNTNMYRFTEDVIDEWNSFAVMSNLSINFLRYPLEKTFIGFGEGFYEDMPTHMKTRIGTTEIKYKRS